MTAKLMIWFVYLERASMSIIITNSYDHNIHFCKYRREWGTWADLRNVFLLLFKYISLNRQMKLRELTLGTPISLEINFSKIPYLIGNNSCASQDNPPSFDKDIEKLWCPTINSIVHASSLMNQNWCSMDFFLLIWLRN